MDEPPAHEYVVAQRGWLRSMPCRAAVARAASKAGPSRLSASSQLHGQPLRRRAPLHLVSIWRRGTEPSASKGQPIISSLAENDPEDSQVARPAGQQQDRLPRSTPSCAERHWGRLHDVAPRAALVLLTELTRRSVAPSGTAFASTSSTTRDLLRAELLTAGARARDPAAPESAPAAAKRQADMHCIL
ncbi:hypothetical protein ACCO45_001448 [Purpureocillium lilacinum]|uniref:Uncharacterized protein n=1 Tax=Purpureocillium lilacinum TaxID=33203 RepID=A0ACC4E730_PURLI